MFTHTQQSIQQSLYVIDMLHPVEIKSNEVNNILQTTTEQFQDSTKNIPIEIVNFSNYPKYLFFADKLSLSNRTASSGLRENFIPCNFV